MKRAKTLRYKHAEKRDAVLFFIFEIDDLEFSIQIRHTGNIQTNLPIDYQQIIINNIGMCICMELAEIVMPFSIQIDVAFSQKQLTFWQFLYNNLPREKVFVEHLPVTYLQSEWDLTNPVEPATFSIHGKNRNILLGVSGGKDSLCALKLLENSLSLTLTFLDTDSNIFQDRAANVLKNLFPNISSTTNSWNVYKDLEITYESAMYSGCDVGHLVFQNLLYSDSHSCLLLGNEWSANFGNTSYQGLEINHQFVKSIEFAEKINEYIHTFITADFLYTSPFFGLSEYAISNYFFRDMKYMYLWTSCNHPTATSNFCSDCYKCAFIYIMGLVWKDKKFLGQFFSRPMLDNIRLTFPLMDPDTIKPLECVGEKKEVWVALYQIYKQRKDINSLTMQYFIHKIYPYIKDDMEIYEKEVLSMNNTTIDIPEEIQFIYNKFV